MTIVKLKAQQTIKHMFPDVFSNLTLLTYVHWQVLREVPSKFLNSLTRWSNLSQGSNKDNHFNQEELKHCRSYCQSQDQENLFVDALGVLHHVLLNVQLCWQQMRQLSDRLYLGHHNLLGWLVSIRCCSFAVIGKRFIDEFQFSKTAFWRRRPQWEDYP